MDELRVLRREEGSLILANELGHEYRLVVDDGVAQEVKLATRRTPSAVRVRPREIQALLRAGKNRAEVAAETGLDEADVQRFEEPVRAEQRYMLDLAHGVSVRTEPGLPGDTAAATDDDQRFGQVISERLIGLGNTVNIWRSWRDEEAGWMIGLEFDSRDGDHDAIWSFDHKKRILTPLTPDATNLSKIGDVGDRLIPKLRAVDSETEQKREAQPFDPDALLAPTAEVEPLSTTAAADIAHELNPDAEYERRREIDHLAISTPADGDTDLSQTADLLDALRRRRGERALEQPDTAADHGASPDSSAVTGEAPDDTPAASAETLLHALVDPTPPTRPVRRPGAATNIWGATGVSGITEDTTPTPATPPNPGRRGEQTSATGTASATDSSAASEATATPSEGDAGDATGHRATQPAGRLRSILGGAGAPPTADDDTEATVRVDPKAGDAKRTERPREGRRGRSSIPSWDDILFGTRSDDDPA